MERLKLEDIICELHPVTEIFLREMENVFDAWYPLKQDGCDVDMGASKTLFDERREYLMRELTEKAHGPVQDPMPCMRHNARRNTVEHPKLGTIGCGYFFGGESRNLDATSFLSSPIWLGERVRVRWSAKIVGPSLIESDVFMNTSSVITRSVICAGSQIDDLAVVKDSILGRKVFVEPGVKILHRFGFDCEEILIRDMCMKPGFIDRKSTRLNSSHTDISRMPSSA